MKGEEFNFFTPEIRGSTETEWDGGGLEVGIEARSWIIWRDVLAEVIGEMVEKQRKEKHWETSSLIGERRQEGLKEDLQKAKGAL